MPKKSDKQKPLLHLIRGSADPGLHCEDLSWLVTCYDSICGLSTVSGLNPSPEQQTMSGPVTITESNWYTDAHCSFGKDGHFSRARRIWKALTSLPYDQQTRLLKWYEPRQFFPKEYQPVPETVIRIDHAAYYEARKGLRG